MKRWLVNGLLARGNAQSRPGAGYTITEVMVVLAVTTAMFVVIVMVFSGRQARVEFTQAVRNFEAKVQTAISDVATGYYRSDGYECVADTPGAPIINTEASARTGTNSGCIFVGKILNPNNTSSVIHTVVGRRSVPGGLNVSSYAEARPVTVPVVDETYGHSFGLRVVRMVSLESNAQIYALGFMKPLSDLDASTGSRTLELYGAMQAGGFTSGTEINLNHFQKLPEGALICLRGQNGQLAEISIGAARGQTTVFSTLDTKPGSGEPCYGA